MLEDKLILITGLASTRSIAYGIAQQAAKNGARLILTYQNEKIKSRVEDFASEFGAEKIIECDVSSEENLSDLADYIKMEHNNALDGLVHSVAYAPSDQLQGDFLHDINKEGFRIAHEISSYSLCALSKYLKYPLINGKGSIVTLTYIGSERFVPNYNTMGLAKASLEAAVRYLAASFGQHDVRINAISSGVIKTLAASGIKGLKEMLQKNSSQSLLKRNVDIEEIGNLACFLLSPLASCLTGQVIVADCGYSITAM